MDKFTIRSGSTLLSSLGNSNKEYDDILKECKNAIAVTKKEMNDFKFDSADVLEFMKNLQGCLKEAF
jgi:hypothetical protein